MIMKFRLRSGIELLFERRAVESDTAYHLDTTAENALRRL
jgi:hypothetical protein